MKRLVIQLNVVVALGLVCLPSVSWSHHSVQGFFDISGEVLIEGVVKSITWRNPHTVFEVDVTEPSGEVTQWHIETGALSWLRARGISEEFLHDGDQIKIMGKPSTRGKQELFAANILLANGKEVILVASNEPYFSSKSDEVELIETRFDPEVERQARLNADGIFRVWSTDFEGKTIPRSTSRLFNGKYPVTDEALARRKTWNIADVTLLGCTKWAMPRLMSNPGAMEFVRQDDGNIWMRFWEDDNRRLVHMGENPQPPEEHSLMGFSTGRWDGDTLVVKTTHIVADVLDMIGTPQSDAITLVERFTAIEDETQLHYTLTVTDPETLTDSFTVERRWLWLPQFIVDRYGCGEAQTFQIETIH